MHKLIGLNILAALALLAAGWLPAQSQKPGQKSGEEARIDSIVMAAELHEVVVTAKESQGTVTASRIDRSAMEFLQPTSLSDLMQLLPGGQQKDPDLSAANTIGLRETGTMDAQGNSSVNNNYAISSLGTLFVVDGNPLSTDANMQYTPLSSTQSTTTTSSTENNLNTTNRGVDMRSISTDDVESVEVVRGIPSVEYGNLTSGMVKINKIRRSTPFTARFKADGYSKLLSLGKGLKLSHTALLNIDASMLDAKPDPTNNLQKYRRGNGSLRLTLNTDALRYSAAVDYTGSFDNSKSDPDINYGRIDEYKSTYNKIAITNNISWRPTAKGLFKSFDINTLITQQFDRLTQRRLVAPQRYGIVPTTSEEGVHDAALIFSEYEASFLSDGKPFTAYAKAKANFALTTGALTSNLLAGADWNYAKNFGRGQVYDLSRPLSVSGWGSRPRKFSDIPALSQVSAFIEYNGKAELASHRLELQAGLRTNSLTGLDSRYAMKGHIYLDPRANLKWSLPAWEWAGHRIALSFAGGMGKTSKMPTLNYLYPDKHYNDITELGYYDPNHPQDYSRFVVRSYIQDPTNYNIRPASNIKKELRMDFSFGDNTISVDYFRENMSSGFRYMAVYGVYDYNDYDETAIDSRSLTGKPSLEGLPYTPKRKLDGYTRADNGTRIDKEGIEFQFTSARIRPLRTRVNINGAWFKTRYSNSLPMFVSVADVVDGSAVSDRYVGLYDWNDGDWNETLSTNLMFDTQIPEWGLIFATSVQCSWFVKTQDMPKRTPYSISRRRRRCSARIHRCLGGRPRAEPTHKDIQRRCFPTVHRAVCHERQPESDKNHRQIPASVNVCKQNNRLHPRLLLQRL
ncbi:MAG: TonB-dependent receptor plug domain-containing protein [Bacteroidales bacterium]|nr:MAG: TonB-dependent receptor plug domain-containing protein [Bacteroidales bacterium]